MGSKPHSHTLWQGCSSFTDSWGSTKVPTELKGWARENWEKRQGWWTKNFNKVTGFIHMCVCVSMVSHPVVFDSLWPHGCSLPGPSVQWNIPGNNIGTGCHFLLQGMFTTQGSNTCLLCLLHWQMNSLPLHHLGTPLFICTNDVILFWLISISAFYFKVLEAHFWPLSIWQGKRRGDFQGF